MISRRFIGLAVLIIVLVAVTFSGFAYEVSRSVFWNWLGTLLATFISILAAIGVGLLLFNYQTSATDERKRRDLVRLTATELNKIIDDLEGVDTESNWDIYVYCPMSEQAARSGLLDIDTTASMMHFSSSVQIHNQIVTHFNTEVRSMETKPEADTFLKIMLNMERSNRETTIMNAKNLLREIEGKYPGAFAQD